MWISRKPATFQDILNVFGVENTRYCVSRSKRTQFHNVLGSHSPRPQPGYNAFRASPPVVQQSTQEPDSARNTSCHPHGNAPLQKARSCTDVGRAELTIMLIRPINEFDGKGWFRHKSRPPGTRIATIVLHASAGSNLSGAVSTLRAKGYGYHFLIEPSGQVWKGAPISSNVAHAGVSVGPQGPSANAYSIGVCLINLNDGVHAPTAKQLEALEELLPMLKPGMDEYKNLCTHYALTVKPSGKYRKSDPRMVDVTGLAAKVGLTPWKPSYSPKYAL